MLYLVDCFFFPLENICDIPVLVTDMGKFQFLVGNKINPECNL